MRYINGNIVDTNFDVIIHGCNAQGKMGTGVAKAIRDKWPDCYKEYVQYLDQYEFKKGILGSWLEYKTPEIRIFNLITQEFYGYDGKYARYIDIAIGVNSILESLYFDDRADQSPIAISKIGCSLGGLNWQIVEELLLELEERYGREFVVYEINDEN